MKKQLIYFMMLFFCFFILTNSCQQIWAQNDTSKLDLYEMDLSSLLNMELSTVSKKAQSASEAPAIVTIITADQIENLGVQTLTELMTYVPGFTVADSYWKRQIVTSRGIKMTLYNDKILMLINGIAAYDAAALEHYLDVMPITSIKQIEIIRGPGSTLYGTNAFSAVINIITKDGKENQGAYSYIKGGSFGTKEIGLSLDNHIGNIYYHFGSVIEDNVGYKKFIECDEKGRFGDIIYEYDNDNVFTSINYKDFTFNGGYLYQTYVKYGPAPDLRYSTLNNFGTAGRTFTEKAYGNLIFNKIINTKLSTKVSVHYDYSDHQADLAQFGYLVYYKLKKVDSIQVIPPDYYRFGGYLYQGEGQISYSFNEKLNLMLGVAGESRTTTNLADLYSDLNGKKVYEGSTKDLPIDAIDYGGFLQADGKLWKLGYAAGVRATYLGVSEKLYITPRAGLVYGLNKSSSIKLLYGEAFRGPGPQEQYYKVPTLIYGADALDRQLKPELIKTIELAGDIGLLKNYKIRANGFYNLIQDAINRRAATKDEITLIDPTIGGTSIYDNLGKQTIMGGELELAGYPTNYLNFFANISYKDGAASDVPYAGKINKDSTINYDYLPYVEKISGNVGLTFKWKGFSITPTAQYIGEKEGPLSGNSTVTKYKKDSVIKVEAYNLLHLTVKYQFNQNLNISFSIRNLLDAKYYYPEDVRRQIPAIPGGPPRAVFFKISYGFKKI